MFMELEQIKDRMLVGKHKSFTVCVDEVVDFPGYVRAVRLLPVSRVSIQCEQFGRDEGGVYYWGDYPSLEDAVAAIEVYLGSPRSVWTGGLSYPGTLASMDSVEGGGRLANAIANGGVPLPLGVVWRLQSGYWSRFESKG
ncbi:hypothetical protein HUW62_33365 [Myxococcus sp. AM011]|uniref:hypothetical protein n=1 Tax=Myxococcus sp. AM011 TaxID=2745200 RepID=UPI001595DB0F|nr:hypothetical protein [Myxococcus sp. AM011]NVJ26125.1 hypothetical protein [Myxococcus sp. AM011]